LFACTIVCEGGNYLFVCVKFSSRWSRSSQAGPVDAQHETTELDS